MQAVHRFLFLLLVLTVTAASAQRNFTIVRYLNVSTTLGPVRGAVIETSGPEDGSRVHIGSFLGINFAKVPTGEFRFAHPVFTQWDFVQDAISFDRRCFQDPGSTGDFSSMAESCIAANIWTPFNGTSSSPGSHPVLVWLHGGRFESGSIIDESYSGRVLTSHERIVTVSLQYRLGVLGFLRLSSTVAPGNMGLKDQALGLQFVHNNIERFGGNLQTITLMGLDAGAASVGYHMLNEQTRNYFKRAVMLGGSPMVFWSVRQNTRFVERLHLNFAVLQLGCPGPNNDDFTPTIECLRNVSPERLVNAQKDFIRLFQGIEFPPVIDGDYIKEDPFEAFKNGRFEGKSLMIGVTSAEAGVYVERSLQGRGISKEELANSTIYEGVLRDQFFYFDRQPDRLQETGHRVVIDRLTDFGNPEGEAQYQRWLNGASDRIFVCAANQFAELMLSKVQGTANEIYYYVFSEPDAFTTSYHGASHGQDAYYFFGNPSDDAPIVKPEQKVLSDIMMGFLASFVASGDPVPRDADKSWAKYNNTHRHYFNFTTDLSTDFNVPYGFRRDHCGFWDKSLTFVNDLVEPPLPTTTSATTATSTPTAAATASTTESAGTPTAGTSHSTSSTAVSTATPQTTDDETIFTTSASIVTTKSLEIDCTYVFNQAATITLSVLLPTNGLTLTAVIVMYFKVRALRGRVGPV